MRSVATYAMLANMTTDAIIPMGASEACDQLGVSRDTLIRMIAAGKIKKSYKLPGSNGDWIVDRDEIGTLAADNEAREQAAKAVAS